MNLDETFDTIFCRPAAAPVAKFLHRHTKMTPDQVTGLVALFGLGLVVFYGAGGLGPVFGALLFLVVMVLDCVDGQLARMRGGGTWQGRVVDGLADMVGAVSAHVGLLIALVNAKVTILGHTFGWTTAFLLLLAAGASMIWNARVFDGLKQNLKPESIDNEREQYRDQVKTLFDRFVFWFWADYASHIAGYRGADQEQTYRLLRRAQWAGPTNHHFLMVLTGFAMPWFPLAPVIYAVVCIVPLNLIAWSAARPCRAAARPAEIAG